VRASPAAALVALGVALVLGSAAAWVATGQQLSAFVGAGVVFVFMGLAIDGVRRKL
jgi:hypothetical protein